MHEFINAAVVAAIVAPTSLVLGLVAYIELTRSRISIRARR
ncbi:MAG: hypothetical protein WCE44_04730 [Candidatus Velthaea sp.]|jgi:ABC-type spermidine/putrescine transport system permease subunit II